MSVDGQGSKQRRNIADNFYLLSRVHQRYRQTDRRQPYSEHECEFTLAKNRYIWLPLLRLNPRQRGCPGLISVKCSVDVNGCPRYYMS